MSTVRHLGLDMIEQRCPNHAEHMRHAYYQQYFVVLDVAHTKVISLFQSINIKNKING